MRAIVIVLGLVLASGVARANTVVVLASPDAAGAELDDALRIVLAGRGTTVASAPAPAGQLRLERAAAAQRLAVQVGADAAVWLDEADVCAVTSDGHEFRHAPFPAETASPRAFAAIATSLLDEMIAPPPWAQGLAINVHVDITGAGGPPTGMAPPGMIGSIDAAPSPGPRHKRDARTLLEVGPLVAPLAIGVELGVALPLSRSWRLAPMVAAAVVPGDNVAIGAAVVELRRVGAGSRRHWDFGPLIGAATDGVDPVVLAGARIARTWERAGSALSASLAPIVLAPVGTGTTTPSFLPGIWASLRWQFAL